MTTKTVNIILAALAAILLLKIYNEDKEIKRLTKHVENVSQNSSEPPVSSSIHASADSATAPLQTSSAPTTHSPAKPTIVPPSQEEISKILQRAKHDLVIAEAFKNNCNAGGGYGNIEIKSQEDCDKFWRSIESRDDMLKRHTQYLNQIVSQLDFSATSDDDKAILDKYISLREKYKDILYDESASPEEITDTYNSLHNLQDKAKTIISNAITHTFGDKIQQFNQMKKEMIILIHAFTGNPIVGVHHYGYNGKTYNIVVPEKDE